MSNVTYSAPQYDPYSLEAVVHRTNQGLNFENGDPLIADFAFIHTPIKLISSLILIVISIKLTQLWMYTRSTPYSFARPVFLVNCGLCFGMNGCGFFVLLVVSNNGSHLFRRIELSDLSLYTIYCRYVVFSYFVSLIYDLAALNLVALRKQTVSNLIIVRQLIWIAIAYTIVKHQSVGFTLAVPLIHCLLKVMNNMLTVMETASSELKPEEKWAKRIELASIILHFTLMCHLGYFSPILSTHSTWVTSSLLTLVAIQTISILSLTISSANTHKSIAQLSSINQEFESLILG